MNHLPPSEEPEFFDFLAPPVKLIGVSATQKLKALITDPMAEGILELLNQIGVLAEYKPIITPEEVLAQLKEYDILICRTRFYLDDTYFQAAPKLKLIVRAGAGIDDIDLQAAQNRGIALLNAPEGNRDAVGEHAVGLLLALLNKIHLAYYTLKYEQQWLREPFRGEELGGKTVGIVGFGNMGQAFAKRLAGFGVRVLAYDKYLRSWPQTPHLSHVEPVDLATLQAEADVLSLHTPLTAETKQLLNQDFINQMAKPFFLLNTSRGGVVEQEALLSALENGKVRGAALDVLAAEKIPFPNTSAGSSSAALLKHPKVLVSPHVAGWTLESYQKINQVVVAKIALWRQQNAV